MVDIDIQEVLNHLDDVLDSTQHDKRVMEAEYAEFYDGIIFAYREMIDWLVWRKQTEEHRWKH